MVLVPPALPPPLLHPPLLHPPLLQLIDAMLHKDRLFGIALPRLPARTTLEGAGQLEPRISVLDEEFDEAALEVGVGVGVGGGRWVCVGGWVGVGVWVWVGGCGWVVVAGCGCGSGCVLLGCRGA